MSKLSKFLGILYILFLAGLGTAMAQSGTHAEGPTHSHKAHHEGVVKSAGDYHIELVEKADNYRIYLLDIRERPINIARVSGIAFLRDGDKTIGTQKLSPAGSFFELPLKGLNPSTILINLTVNNQHIIAKFDTNAKNASAYHCPQNCTEVASSTAGLCPKCGSKLALSSLVAKD